MSAINRRAFMTCVSGALIAFKAAGEEEGVQIERQLQLAGYPDANLLGVAGSGDSVYALLRDRVDRRNYSLTRSALSGESTWTVALSGGDFSQLSVTRNGNCLLLMLNRAPTREAVALEYGTAGNLLRSSKVTARMVIASRLSSGSLVTFQGNGTVRVQDFNSGRLLKDIPGAVRPVSIGEHVPRVLTATIESIADDVVLVIDQVTGRLARLELTTGASRSARIDDPAFQYGLDSGRKNLESLKAVVDKNAGQGRRVSFGTPVVIHASASDGAGGIYCMMSPIDPVRPLILKIDSYGEVIRRVRCVLPNRADKRDKVPMYVTAWPGRLLLAFQDGAAATYKF